ncbi:MAG: monovalent cation/H(+) antiporter subunit G [Planctomycetota bacterium]|jgi:multicomponent Na+:H+ antiporter subunit G|nr:monovalent cation/H(+) antiporter subunit G [Planctomycetota bacterium]MDP6938761.1 monovalent cation/H(+) antiporter subunit G [Planctomycetota bacterium]
MMILDVLSWFLLVGGSVLCVIGGLGLLRLPDVYTRAHAAGINDTLGAWAILLGLMLQAGLGLVTIKLAMIGLFIALVGPVSSHALLKAAYAHDVRVRGSEEEVPHVD